MLKVREEILSHMQDEMSKEIYKNRILYNNNNTEYLEKIVRTVEGGKELIEFLNDHDGDLYVFGAGVLGKEFIRTWKTRYSFSGIIDNDNLKWGKTIEQIPIIGLSEIQKERKDMAIIIVNKFSYDDIERQIKKEQIRNENIFNFGRYFNRLNHAQYFDLNELNKNQKERFIDCGALDGKTSISMYEWYKSNIEKIWLFEPDKESVQKCKENLRKLDSVNYEIIEKAVYSSAKRLLFDSTGNGMASISTKGNVMVDTISLDEAVGNEKPSFIKMDIEGAELEALKGAKKTIQRYKPKLAICVYHKPEDIEEIPLLLLSYNSDYKFYLRHYSLTMNETVLYAL